MFVTSPDVLQGAIWQIQQDLVKQVDYFKEIGKHLEAKRLEERTNFDLEMIRELGYCSELKIIPLSGWKTTRNKTVLFVRLFSKDFLLVVDESHVTLSSEPCMEVTEAERKFGRIWLPTSCSDGQSTVKI
jgi:excinuclease ABC subunit B